eukprot:TRINITY_DN23169_c0_g1_i1.p2 TRINITY_DN23169_c0_g1~~TRINITY_DN23169_c0_g1_i1.p2  ORF type:complete len:216 (+),score=85.52 TRINITY_DN23169_c0_g1_i1:26-649(+)
MCVYFGISVVQIFGFFSESTKMTDFTTYDDDPILGKAAPSFASLKLVRGEPAQFENRTVALLIWAKFDKGVSPQCLDTFNAVAKKYPGITFVAVSVDPAEADAARYFEKGAPVDYPVYWDDSKTLANSLKELLEAAALGVPYAFIFSAEGKVIWAEQFSQFLNPIEKSTVLKQLEKIAAGEPLISNGKRPVKEVIEEEQEGDFGALF